MPPSSGIRVHVVTPGDTAGTEPLEFSGKTMADVVLSHYAEPAVSVNKKLIVNVNLASVVEEYDDVEQE